MKTRRSIRRYKTTAVNDKTVELVLEAARWAPSWANTQCWRFIIVRSESLKTALADTLLNVEETGNITPNPANESFKQAPVLIVACAVLEKSGYHKDLRKVPVTDKGDWYMFDVALAMQNLVLAAHSLGLGTVHVGSFNAKKAANILGVPLGICVVEMTPLGYPDQEPKARPRRKLSEITFHESFGVE
ncbi:nitroreductase family protein [Chloroflexota bacterium]